MTKTLLAALCAAVLLSNPAQAKDDGTDGSITVLKEMQTFVVQKDGSHSRTVEHYAQLNEARAVAPAAQRQFHFNSSLETVEVIEAYTEKPDGRKIAVQPEQIKLQQEPQYSGAPMFQDMQVKTLIYPDVAVGDKLYSKVRTTRSKALFDGQFSDTSYPLFRPTKQFTLVYDMPDEMPLRADADGFQATPPRRANGRTVYRWDYVPSDNPRIEAGTVSYWDFGRHLVVSTFADYAAVGLAYDKAARPAAAAPSAAVAALARQLVAGLDTPRARALAIHDWVRKNIRYVAVYIGNGGLVPHQAGAILDNRYGDCKDHTTLMEALLEAAGIASTPVLINAGNSYKLSPVASLGEFNHAITYIPALDLYLDSTAENIAGGYLPEGDLDKQVILTRSGELGRTPVAQDGQVRNRYAVQLDADGGASFSFSRANLGWIDEPVRWEHSNWGRADRELFVEGLLKQSGIKGSGEVELGELGKTGGNYTYALRGTAENWAYLPGTVGIATGSSLYAGLAQQVFGLTAETSRTQPYVCPALDFVEDAHYRFPAGAAVLALPRDLHIATPYFHYAAEYRRQDNGVLIHRSFQSGKKDSRVCTPDDYQAMRGDIKKMVQDLRSQFILQAP